MPSYLSPGVYVEEVESGSRPIEGVGTSVAAFIGFARKGPLHEPTPVTNWTQFKNVFGDFAEGAYLPGAVYGFFANGGGICYVVRIGGPDAAGGEQEGAVVAVLGAAGEQARLGPYDVTVLPQVTGQISVEVTDPEGEDPPQDTFGLVVTRDGQVVETYPKLTTKRSKDNAATQVRARSRFIALAESEQGPAPHRPDAQVISLPGAAPGPVELSAQSYIGDAERPHRLRRAGGDRRDHHGLRPRPDERLPEGRDRPGDACRRSSSR